MNVCYNGATRRQNYGTAIEKLYFEYLKSFTGATKNLHQQNPSMTSGIKLTTIPYCTIYYLQHQKSLPYVSIRIALLDFL